jgi:hypothetical protein
MSQFPERFRVNGSTNFECELPPNLLNGQTGALSEAQADALAPSSS